MPQIEHLVGTSANGLNPEVLSGVHVPPVRTCLRAGAREDDSQTGG